MDLMWLLEPPKWRIKSVVYNKEYACTIERMFVFDEGWFVGRGRVVV